MLKPIKRETLPEKITQTIKDYILENDLKPGDGLPTERELASRLSVSRASLRESLKSLCMLGTITATPKIGYVVNSFDMKQLTEHFAFHLRMKKSSLSELLEARLLLEVNIIPLVVQKMDKAAFMAMEKSLKQMKLIAASGGPRNAADEMFHEALFKGTQNQVLESFNEVIQNFFTKIRADVLSQTTGPKEWYEIHRTLYEALLAKDIIAAQELMREHLQRYIRNGFIPVAE